MLRILSRLFNCTRATAAVETAIFAPIFLTLTLGVTDLGSGMFWRMTVNAAAQAGAAYAVINSTSVCASMPIAAACLNGIKTAMNDASGNASFCTGSVCTASITTCVDGSAKCIIVSANYPYTPILTLSAGKFSSSWTKTQTVSSTVTVRVQ